MSSWYDKWHQTRAHVIVHWGAFLIAAVYAAAFIILAVQGINSFRDSPVVQGVASCTLANPSVSLTPSTLASFDGSPQNFKLTVVNNNVGSCSTATFRIEGVAPSGWAITPAPHVISLATAKTGTETITVTSKLGEVLGAKSFTISATNSSNGAYTASVNGTYTVTARPDSTPPTLSITSPNSGFTVSKSSKTSTVISATASDPSGVKQIDIYLSDSSNKLSLKNSCKPPKDGTCSFSWSPGGGANLGAWTITVKAIDNSPFSNTATVTRSGTMTK